MNPHEWPHSLLSRKHKLVKDIKTNTQFHICGLTCYIEMRVYFLWHNIFIVKLKIPQMHSTNREHSGPSRHFCGLALINAGEIWVAISIKFTVKYHFPKYELLKQLSYYLERGCLSINKLFRLLEQVLTFGSLEWTAQTQKNKNNNERHFTHFHSSLVYGKHKCMVQLPFPLLLMSQLYIFAHINLKG